MCEREKDTFIVVAIDRAGHELHHPFAHHTLDVAHAAELAHRGPCSGRRRCVGCGELAVLV